MAKRRMVGWQPLAVENTDAHGAPAQSPAPVPPQPEPTPIAPVAQPQVDTTPVAQTEAPAEVAQDAVGAQASGLVQDPDVPRRRMAGWQPLVVANTAAPAAAPVASAPATPAPAAAADAAEPAPAASPAGPLQDPAVPRRRMAGWQPQTVAHDTGVPATVPTAGSPTQPAAAAPGAQPAAVDSAPVAATAASVAPQAAPAPVTQDLPRRRMAGWQPLKVGHPATVAPVVEEPTPAPATQPAAQPVASTPAPKRMGAQPAATPATTHTPAAASGERPQPTMPEVVTPPAATTADPGRRAAPKKPMSKVTKVVLTLLGVAVVAAGLVLVAQWFRTLDPVAEFIGTYDGTPTHPDGVVAGIPAWVGWQHFFNFFIIVMVIRSGFIIRNQERPEAYWTPKDGGFYSPNTKNSPQKVSIQQWIHQSFNVLWVVNGVVFYVMVFATGHWMRIVPTNWDIFPNLASAAIQYMSLDWPAENAWVYYNALQVMTYFITVFIAAPIAVLTGVRLSTWWPQKADRLNKAFTLPVARKIHFGTMLYFVLFIIVHLFLVFTTGILHNLNMMFTARDASDWIGIAVFAGSIAVTVGVAWLIKPIFISPIAEKTGSVSTR